MTERIANIRDEATELSTGERRSFGGHNSHCALVYQKAGGGNEVLQSASSRSMSSRVGSINEANAKRNRKRGMILPFEPLYIAFDSIRYAVDIPQVSCSITPWKIYSDISVQNYFSSECCR